jgi:hypothetical protein
MARVVSPSQGLGFGWRPRPRGVAPSWFVAAPSRLKGRDREHSGLRPGNLAKPVAGFREIVSSAFLARWASFMRFASAFSSAWIDSSDAEVPRQPAAPGAPRPAPLFL